MKMKELKIASLEATSQRVENGNVGRQEARESLRRAMESSAKLRQHIESREGKFLQPTTKPR
jgi:exonuclease VII small subunit